MTTQLTQGQQRLKTVNQIAVGLFILFVLIGEVYVNFMLSALPYIIPLSLFLTYYIRKVIKTIYVRETGELAEGFYTQRSWLDVDDNVLVSVTGNDVSFFEIPDGYLPEVQKGYQQGLSFEKLVEEARVKKDKVIRISMSTIDKMASSHKEDTIGIDVNDDYHSIEFLNIKTKEHALKRFQLLLDEALVYRQTKPTRLRAALPWLITLCVFAIIMFLFQNAVVWGITFGIGFFLILPKLLRELIDPTQMEIWEKEDA